MSEATLQADVAVIGAGVAGLSIAYFLAPHARVVVLEQEAQPAYHSSGRSAALFIEGYENSVVSGLTTASRDFFFAPPPGFADAPLVHPRGGLTVASKDERGALQTYLRRWQPLCPDLQAVTPARARELVPVLREDWLGGAAYDPSWQSIDVHELLMGYQRGLKAAGGRVLCNAPAHSLTRESGARGTTPRWHIETPAASVSAAVVVNAGGAWANRVAAAAGLEPLPVTPMRRTAAIVPLPEEGRMWPVVHTIAGNLYFKPESPGLMVCPQDESPTEPLDAYPEELDVAIALDRLLDIAEMPVERVLHQWAGLRTFAADRRPVVGFDPRTTGFFWLAGQGGFGVQTSPRLGALGAAAINDGAHVPDDFNVLRLIASAGHQ